MKVYAVLREDGWLDSIFSTKEKADQYIQQGDNWYIWMEEIEVDESRN